MISRRPSVRYGRGERGQMRERDAVRPMDILDPDHDRAAGAGAPQQLANRLALAAVTGLVVHGVVDRAQVRWLGGVEQVVEEQGLGSSTIP